MTSQPITWLRYGALALCWLLLGGCPAAVAAQADGTPHPVLALSWVLAVAQQVGRDEPPSKTPTASTAPAPSAAASPNRTLAAARTPQGVYDLLAQSDHRGALALGAELVRRDPGDVRAWVALANAQWAAGQLSAAQATAHQAQVRLGSKPELLRLQKALTAGQAPHKGAAPEQSPGWVQAQQGYQAYQQADFAKAVGWAQQAVQLAPDSKDYRGLLINALQGAERYAEVEQAIVEATARFGPDDRWRSSLSVVQGRFAIQAAADVYRALERADPVAATTHARRAVALAPDMSEYRMLLMDVLTRRELWADAEQVAREAVEEDGEDVIPLIFRAHLRHRLGRYAQSAVDFDGALARPMLDGVQRRWLLLIAADSALAAGDVVRATTLLAPGAADRANDDEWRHAVAERRQALAVRPPRSRGPAPLDRLDEHPALAHDSVLPIFRCRTTPYGRACLVVPGAPQADAGYPLANRAYAAMAQHHTAEAADLAAQAVVLAPRNVAYLRLWVDALMASGRPVAASTVVASALADHPADVLWRVQAARVALALGQREQAQAHADQALALGGLEPSVEVELLLDVGRTEAARLRLHDTLDSSTQGDPPALSWAYLALRAGDDALAHAVFAAQAQRGALAAQAHGDAGFTALRLRLDADAEGHFKKAIDLNLAQWPSAQAASSSQPLLALKRSVAEVSRRMGLMGSWTQGSERGQTGVGYTGLAASSQSTVAGLEAYWRPWGYQNGEYLEPFVRAYAVLRDSSGGPTGFGEGVASVGLRYKPMSAHSLMLSAWRQVPLNGRSAGEWLAQVSYFNGLGTDLRVDLPAWWTAQVSADVARGLRRGQVVASLDLRAGRNHRLGDGGARWVAQPFVAWHTDHNSDLTPRLSSTVDVGLGLRRWFRESTYTAPMSSVDIELRRRVAHTGAKANQATQIRVSWSY